MNSSGSSDQSPRSTYRVMAGFAIAIILLLFVAIFSLSRLQSAPWTSSLKDLKITADNENGSAVPSFSLNSDGRTFSNEDLKGQWALLSFWSSTCPPCLEEMPALNQLNQSAISDRLKIITINVDPQGSEAQEQARRLLAENNLSLPSVFDGKGLIKAAFQVDAYPKHFLINPDGKVVWQSLGAYRWDDDNAVEQLVKLTEPPVPAVDAEAPQE